MKLSDELTWRGFVNQTTYKDIGSIDAQPITFYWGVDPSAPSMQVGNLAAAMMVRKFIAAGHKAVLLIGGATGLIGDPDGKSSERTLKSKEEVVSNKERIVEQYREIFGDSNFEVVDNYDWFQGMNYLDFLRDVGKHVPMRQMLGRDFVQSRLGQDGAGISYAEFSYVLIQAYDFLYLHQNHGVTLQLCGSDQWGNSIAGVDLIRRINGSETHVWSTPLVINQSTGKKFGKSEDGAVWLDSSMTSVYKFYQFWLNVDDVGVEGYLKIFTELDQNYLDEIMAEFREAPHARLAQKTLAYEVTKLVHGQEAADSILKISEVLFGGSNYLELSGVEKQIIADEFGAIQATTDLFQDLVTMQLAASKSEARNFVNSGAVSVNGVKVGQEDYQLETGLNLVKRGKNTFGILKK